MSRGRDLAELIGALGVGKVSMLLRRLLELGV